MPGSTPGVDSVFLGYTVQKDAGQVRRRSGPRVMGVLRHLIIDV